MEKDGAAGDPKGGGAAELKLWSGVAGLPKGVGPAAALWPKVGVPKVGLSVVAEPKLKPAICGAALLGTCVPNGVLGMAEPKLNPPDAG